MQVSERECERERERETCLKLPRLINGTKHWGKVVSSTNKLVDKVDENIIKSFLLIVV